MFNFIVSTFLFMTGVSKRPDDVFLHPSVKQLCLLFQKLCGTNYPTSICFIVVNEFCERFSYYGMKGMRALCLDVGRPAGGHWLFTQQFWFRRVL